jgi:serine/threonine-protein kinase
MIVEAMPEAGEILGGKYRIERILGEGGMGQVLAARHLHLDQPVAVKLLSREHLGRPMIVERFEREARAAVRLRSEHVARVLDAGRFDDGQPYLVMEYLDGRDLAAELAEAGRLPVAAAIDCVLQVCDAVTEAHLVGIIHRDLKPANIFVTRDGDGAPLLKVLDFGISKLSDEVSDLTSTKMVLGSPPYMSPEQLRASRGADARSDVWSLGVVLYELVSGRRPFLGETLTDLALRISVDPPEPFAPDAPPGLEAVIRRCLAKAPAERYQSVPDLAAALAPFADARGAARIDRIWRRLNPAAAAPSAASSGAFVEAATTLSSATGTFGDGVAPRTGPRWVRIAAVAVAASAIAIGAVVLWPGRGSHDAPGIAPAHQPSPPSAAEAPSGQAAAPSGQAAAASGQAAAADAAPTDAAPAGKSPALTQGAQPTPPATKPAGTGSAGSAAGSAAASATAPVAKPGPQRAPAKPSSRKPAQPGPGSAAPEDLTRSRY